MVKRQGDFHWEKEPKEPYAFSLFAQPWGHWPGPWWQGGEVTIGSLVGGLADRGHQPMALVPEGSD